MIRLLSPAGGHTLGWRGSRCREYGQRVQFLWSLLPGARDARNQVLIGYAWLAALGLWFGVPHVAESGNFDELVDAIGPVGVGIAISFGAFMIGSWVEEITPDFAARARHWWARSYGIEGGVELLESMGEVRRNELGRLEGSIDRESSELRLRLGLLPPLVIAGAAVQYHGFSVWWLVAFIAVAAAFVLQIVRRLTRVRRDMSFSEAIRRQAADRYAQAERGREREREGGTACSRFRPDRPSRAGLAGR